ncbi:MAG: gluconate 2-dehydrogenase subunit 3 family protein [Saprospiraceae bacterium]|nr:MAG: Tat pathway signal sequence domain-containing protein [Bacteroidetes bacterium OLB9]MCO6462875.1 gluconate 2-dehydrogenase subunit 3 family protein [Saprospiraceae bacterium]
MMDRRENIKLLLTGTVATGFWLTTGCNPKDTATAEKIIATSTSGYGRTPEEMVHDAELMSQTFFTEKERKMVEILADIIIPADDKSGSATDAGVPDFIEFMMKDYPKFQLPMRGGLMWLDSQSNKDFGLSFIDSSATQRLELIDKIAYPDAATEDMKFGVRFFNLMRNLTATGFFTSEMGINDLGYVGNRTNQWNGVPDDVLKKFGFTYDDEWKDVYLNIEDQHRIAEWDDKGNLI